MVKGRQDDVVKVEGLGDGRRVMHLNGFKRLCEEIRSVSKRSKTRLDFWLFLEFLCITALSIMSYLNLDIAG
ncbi:hypothetical protein SDJN02_01359, partial [Cucurbita argyrosperma subsp. argyrosperma]